MEMVKNNNFVDLSNEELERVEGGFDPIFWAGVGIGVLASWAVDGTLIATTGKSGSEWVSIGLKSAFKWVKSWF